MQSIEIKDIRIPALGLGTYQLTGKDAVSLILHALDTGYRHIDTAQMYQNEEAVGMAIQESPVEREDIFLTTKVWYDKLDKRHFIPSVEDSLRKLKTSYVDLLLIHWPNESIPLSETMDELLEAQHKGYTRSIGVSNFNTTLLRQTIELLNVDIVCNQVEYHVFLDQSSVLGFLQDHGMMLTAYSPIAKGNVVGHSLLKEIGRKYHKSEVQVGLRWLIQHENVAAIPRSSNPDRITSNFDIFDFELTEKEMQLILILDQHPED